MYQTFGWAEALASHEVAYATTDAYDVPFLFIPIKSDAVRL